MEWPSWRSDILPPCSASRRRNQFAKDGLRLSLVGGKCASTRRATARASAGATSGNASHAPSSSDAMAHGRRESLSAEALKDRTFRRLFCPHELVKGLVIGLNACERRERPARARQSTPQPVRCFQSTVLVDDRARGNGGATRGLLDPQSDEGKFGTPKGAVVGLLAGALLHEHLIEHRALHRRCPHQTDTPSSSPPSGAPNRSRHLFWSPTGTHTGMCVPSNAPRQ